MKMMECKLQSILCSGNNNFSCFPDLASEWTNLALIFIMIVTIYYRQNLQIISIRLVLFWKSKWFWSIVQ